MCTYTYAEMYLRVRPNKKYFKFKRKLNRNIFLWLYVLYGVIHRMV